MDKQLYKEIFRRKSFHTFRERSNDSISQTELDDILDAYKKFDNLYDIKTDIKIVRAEDTTCKRHEEYCIMMFSEIKDGYLQNIGYLGEQLDLYLVSKNIGSLWFGIAKSKEIYNGLNYVIMIAIAKVNEFRKDMYKSKRKELNEIWNGEDLDIANVVRYAPSACNSQPWYVENKDNKLYVYRKSKSGRVGIMPKNASVFYNQIDIGIFMCILEICLLNKDIKYNRQTYKDNESFDNLELNATYELQ